MTVVELEEALIQLTKRGVKEIEVLYVEDHRGELHELESLDVEQFDGNDTPQLVLRYSRNVADV